MKNGGHGAKSAHEPILPTSLVARMERSEIRGHPIHVAIPGLRCAASGLRGFLAVIAAGRAATG
jgi:hypothetical protein